MPPAQYLTMPESSTAEGREARNAEQVLAKLADRLVMSGHAISQVMTIVFLVSLVITGEWLRSLYVPHWWGVAAAAAFVAGVGLAMPAMSRQAGDEPEWARAAAAHEQSVWDRLPEDMRAMLREFTASMTTGTRWQGSARVYVAQCKGESGTHYAPCCAGGTLVMNGRLLVIIGEHLAMGPIETARAVLAHERRHIKGWRLHAFMLATIAQFGGLLIAGWAAASWPALLIISLALCLARMITTWLIEISCDLGSATETSTDAMTAAVAFKLRTEGATRALQRAGKRALTALTYLTGTEHPPYSLRTAA
jgi:hypothetical protein